MSSLSHFLIPRLNNLLSWHNLECYNLLVSNSVSECLPKQNSTRFNSSIVNSRISPPFPVPSSTNSLSYHNLPNPSHNSFLLLDSHYNKFCPSQTPYIGPVPRLLPSLNSGLICSTLGFIKHGELSWTHTIIIYCTIPHPYGSLIFAITPRMPGLSFTMMSLPKPFSQSPL